MSKQPDFAYLLRYAIDPGHGEEAHAEMLRAFLQAAEIDDVSLFTEGEELSGGHMTTERQEAYAALFRRVKPLLREAGVGFSINHWSTLYHSDRGRKLTAEQPFRPMVDGEGRVSELAACPLCPEFRGYFLNLIRRFGALQPRIFWIEDDFRFHNHAPLQWGGCFCDAHMAEYQRRAGAAFTRQEFVEALLAPGTPHPYRQVWLDTCRDTLVEFAAQMRAAMDAVSPCTRLGLMSSNPANHCAEGRDWDALLRALSGSPPITHRIHLPSYLERTPQEYAWLFNTISLPCRAAGPAEAEIYPELENFPFSPFTKSMAFTRFQMELALALDLKGMTLDLFDICATGIHQEDGHAANLRAMKPFLNACNASKALAGERLGVQVLFSTEASRTVHTDSARMEALYPRETLWGGILGAMGIPFAFRREAEGLSGAVVAVSGQYFRNLEESAVRSLLQHNYVLMDGEAAHTLWQMGLGALAGIASVERVSHESGLVCYEESVIPEVGFAAPRAGSQVFLGDSFLIDYLPGARPASRLMRYDRSPVGVGLCVFEERALVLPYACEEYPGGLFHRLRQTLIERELVAAARRFALPALSSGAANLGVYAFAHRGKLALFLANASTDPVERVRLWLPECPSSGSARALVGDAWQECALSAQGDRVILALPLPPMRCALVILE